MRPQSAEKIGGGARKVASIKVPGVTKGHIVTNWELKARART
jgi:hypothetical protein